MITKYNSTLYLPLFNKVNEILGLEGDDIIGDIGDYFCVLGEIKNAVKNDGQDPSVLILPVDEALFEINANDRTIKIPDDFAKYGVGVKGDELAEIVYFSIDRYFDLMDLFYKDIFIQWELSNGFIGLTPAINTTINYVPGKVVFGWPISKEITDVAGNVKFSVRFYQRGKDKNSNDCLLYSFSTLTNVVKINPGLDFNIDAEDDITNMVFDKNDQIYAGLVSSKVDDPSKEPALPIFDELTPIQDTEYNENQQFSGRALFDRQEKKIMGTISYSWKYKNKKGDITDIVGTNQYLPIQPNEEKKTNDIYYVETEQIPGQYEPFTGEWTEDNKSNIYKLYTTYTGDAAGEYYIEATNHAGRRNTVSVNSSPWKIAFAKPATITLAEKHFKLDDSTNSVIIDLTGCITSPDKGDMTYQWFKNGSKINEATSLSYSANAEGNYTIQVKNTKNKDTTESVSENMRVSYAPSAITINKELVNNELNSNITFLQNVNSIGVEINELAYSDEVVYQWYFTNEDADELIEGANEATLTMTSARKPGQYYVKVINTYNTFTTEATSGYFGVVSFGN